MANETTPAQVARSRRREQVAAMYAEGKTQAEIGRTVGLNQSQVSRIIAALEREWRVAAHVHLGALRVQELDKLDAVERKAWAAWKRSRLPRERRLVRRKTSAPADEQTQQVTIEGRDGSAAFLQRVGDCIDSRCKLLGLYADDEEPSSASSPGAGFAEKPLTEEEREIVRAAILKRLQTG